MWTLRRGPRVRRQTRGGGVVAMSRGQFAAGGDFPLGWLRRHINAKYLFALHEVLYQYCRKYPGALERAQVSVDVDNQSVVHTPSRKGAANGTHTHVIGPAILHAGSPRVLGVIRVDTDSREKWAPLHDRHGTRYCSWQRRRSDWCRSSLGF